MMMKLDNRPDQQWLPLAGGYSPRAYYSAVKKRKLRRHGVTTLGNGVVSIRESDLAVTVQSKRGDDDVLPWFNANVSWG